MEIVERKKKEAGDTDIYKIGWRNNTISILFSYFLEVYPTFRSTRPFPYYLIVRAGAFQGAPRGLKPLDEALSY